MTNSKLATMSLQDLMALNADVVRVIKAKRAQANSTAVYTFQRGDQVSFNGRQGRPMQGVVREVKRTKVSVDCGLNGCWLVGGAMLTKMREGGAMTTKINAK
jgi:hypothetical protein